MYNPVYHVYTRPIRAADVQLRVSRVHALRQDCRCTRKNSSSCPRSGGHQGLHRRSGKGLSKGALGQEVTRDTVLRATAQADPPCFRDGAASPDPLLPRCLRARTGGRKAGWPRAMHVQESVHTRVPREESWQDSAVTENKGQGHPKCPRREPSLDEGPEGGARDQGQRKRERHTHTHKLRTEGPEW